MVTVNELEAASPTGKECVWNPMPDGTESMMTAVAFAVALSTNPSISPVTVPGVFPETLVKEKSKLSAWPGVDANANAHANANAPKVTFFMTRSLVVTPRAETNGAAATKASAPFQPVPLRYE